MSQFVLLTFTKLENIVSPLLYKAEFLTSLCSLHTR